MPPARKPSTSSRNTDKMASTKVKHYVEAITRAKEYSDKPVFKTQIDIELEDRLEAVDKNWSDFQTQYTKMIDSTEDEAELERHKQLFEKVEELYFVTRSTYRKQLKAVPKEQAAQPNAQNTQTTDILGNVQNTWGTFGGDYTKWASFRDLFKAAVHVKDHIPPIQKFQLLKAAIKGPAERTMGAWDLTEANYQKAWERLLSVYEDDYLATQNLVRKLMNIPKLNIPTNKGIRKIIDEIHESKNQLEDYFDTDKWDPLILFMVIDKLDETTYRAWETYRASLPITQTKESETTQTQPTDNTQNVTQAEEGAAGGEAITVKKRKPCKIPTWKNMDDFLEQQSRILLHAENRDNANTTQRESNRSNANQRSNNQSRDSSANRANNPPRDSSANRGSNPNRTQGSTSTYQQSNAMQRTEPNYPPCKLCQVRHPLYHCDVFKDMPYQCRLDYAMDNVLCQRCLRAAHGESRCNINKPNQPCPRCGDNEIFHNSTLCPNNPIHKEGNRSLLNAQAPEFKRAPKA